MANAPAPENYIPILIFIGVGIALGTLTLLLGTFVRPNRPYRAKLAPYESGSPLFQDARVRFPIRYYIIAMLFVIFDIEVVFLYPWAIAFKTLGLEGIVGMGFFLLILIIGFWYEWKKGALEWD
jgi:NADH-quinone oxidoreductase subunit A